MKNNEIQIFTENLTNVNLQHGDKIYTIGNKEPIVFVEGKHIVINKDNDVLIYVPVENGYNYRRFGKAVKIVRDPNDIPPIPVFPEYHRRKKVYDNYIINSKEVLSRQELIEELIKGIVNRDFGTPEELPVIHYESLTVYGKQIYAASWDGDAEYEEIDDYEFDFDLDYASDDAIENLSQKLFELFREDEEIFDLVAETDKDVAMDFINTFILSLSCIYEDEVIVLLEEEAEKTAQENFNARDY